MATSDAQKKASMKYMKENLQEIRFRVKFDHAERIKNRAEEKDMSLRAYLLDLIEKDMQNLEDSDRAQDEDPGESREGCLPL